MVRHGLQGECTMLFYLNAKNVNVKLNPVCILQVWLIVLPREIQNRRGSFSFWRAHQVTEVAQGVPGQLYDALCEAALMADEAGEDGGQAIARSVQHNSGGGSLHCYLGAAALCRATGEKYSLSLFLYLTFILY